MFRELIVIRIGNVEIYTNHLLIPIGVALYFWLSYRFLRKRGYPSELLWKFHLITLAGALLAPPLYFFILWASSLFKDLGKVTEKFVSEAGGMNRAWMTAGIVSFLYLWRVKKIPRIWGFYDNLFPFLAFLFAYMKTFNCFVYGCCFGRPTRMPWGVIFPSYTVAYQLYRNLPLHPVQIYNTIGALIIMGIGFWLLKRKEYDGEVVLWMLFMGGASKIFEILFGRGDKGIGDTKFILLISIITVACVFILFLVIYTTKSSEKSKW